MTENKGPNDRALRAVPQPLSEPASEPQRLEDIPEFLEFAERARIESARADLGEALSAEHPQRQPDKSEQPPVVLCDNYPSRCAQDVSTCALCVAYRVRNNLP